MWHSTTMRDHFLGKKSKGRSWCWRPKNRSSCVQLTIFLPRNSGTFSGIIKCEFTSLASTLDQVRRWFASSLSMNLITQVFRLIISMTYRTFSLEEDSKVCMSSDLILTRVMVTKLLQEWQVDDGVLLQGCQVDDNDKSNNIRSVRFEVSHMVWSHDHSIIPYRKILTLERY